jgi:hypothetical protein
MSGTETTALTILGTLLLCSALSTRFARGLAQLLTIHAEGWERAWKGYASAWEPLRKKREARVIGAKVAKMGA